MKKRDFRDWEFEQINIEFGYKRYYENFHSQKNYFSMQKRGIRL